jgi:hypothetical protein
MAQLEPGGISMVARAILPFVIFVAVAGSAHAQAVLDADPAAAALPGQPAASSSGPAAEWGLGVRLRNVRLPRAMLELFVDRAAGSGSNLGFGVDLVRRKEDFEVQFGAEYERLSVDRGIWIEKGKPIPTNEADFVEFNGFGWFTLEATFVFHSSLTRNLALRYGAGAGLGVLFGEVTHVDRGCDSSDPQSCTRETNGGLKIPYDLPPVMLVVNAVVGLQLRATEKLTINLEGGLRTLPFFGVSGTYFF